MKTIYKNKAVCVIAFCALSVPAWSQQEDTENALNREMTLEREYDPSVQDANKVNILPEVKEPEVKKMAIDYASYTLPADPQKELYILPSGKIMTDIAYNKRRGYFNFGGGNYMNLNGDLGYHILSTEKDKLNLFFSHRSTNGKVKYLQADEKIKAKLNDNLGGLNYRHTFNQADLKIGLKYGYTTFNYYGLNLYPDADRDTQQGNQQIRFNLGVESHEAVPFGYLFDVDYTNFSQKYSYSKDVDGIMEHSIRAKLGFYSSFGGNQLIGVKGQLNYFNYKQPDHDYFTEWFGDYAEITLTPYYKVTGDNWNAKLGANVMFITGDNSKVFVSPHIAADVEVADKTVLYLDADGEIRSNSAYDVSLVNRYANPLERALPSRNWLNSEVGIKSGIAPGFWFNIFAGYEITDNDLFFIQTVAPYTWGNVSELTPLNSKRFKGGVALKYAYQQLFDIHLKGVYNNWSITNDYDGSGLEGRAFGRPDFELNFGVDVRPIEKLTVGLDYYLATGRYQNVPLLDEKMKNINELNLTGTYTINDTFGAYIKLNNVLFQKYELLYGYPLQKFSAMVGININF